VVSQEQSKKQTEQLKVLKITCVSAAELADELQVSEQVLKAILAAGLIPILPGTTMRQFPVAGVDDLGQLGGDA
jgi:hypothetical protein